MYYKDDGDDDRLSYAAVYDSYYLKQFLVPFSLSYQLRH